MSFNVSTFLKGFALIVLFNLLMPQTAQAYIGPGSITLIFQVIASLLVGGLTVIVVYWGRIKKFIKKGN